MAVGGGWRGTDSEREGLARHGLLHDSLVYGPASAGTSGEWNKSSCTGSGALLMGVRHVPPVQGSQRHSLRVRRGGLLARDQWLT